MKYEYLIEQHLLSHSATKDLLNGLGKQGWELVAVTTLYDAPVFYLKRELKK